MTSKFLKSYIVALIVCCASFQTQAQTGPPYQVNWVNQIGVNQSGNILSKNTPIVLWTNAGAISSNVLPANTDGWMEFTTISNSHFIVGLTVNNVIDLDEFTNGIFIDNSTNTFFAYEGASANSLGNWVGGDIFRISREGNLVKYYKNGVVLRSVTANPASVLRIKTAIKLQGKSTPNITTSFDCQLILQGAVTGLEGSSGSGSISLSVSGGAAPYTYNWSSGEQTSSLSNKPQGSYTVTVSDAVGRVQNRDYKIGYKVNWINQIGVSTSGATLTKTQAFHLWTSAGAISSNALTPNVDGWMEFSVVTGAHCILGLAANNVIDLTEFNNAIVIDHASNVYTIYEGSAAPLSGSLQAADVFRISREGSLVKYYRNNIVIRTVTVNPALVLHIKTSIKVPGSSTPYINSSCEGQLILQGTAIGLVGNSGSGSISLSVLGGSSPYSYDWSSGEQTNSLSNKPQGSYTVTVTDATGRVQNRNYNIGYKVNWINPIGAYVSGSVLIKNHPHHTWNQSGAISSNVLPANTDGWMEFSAGVGAYCILGLAVNNVIDLTAFNNAVVIDYASNAYKIYEGSVIAMSGILQVADVFRISREGNLVKYYRNNVVIRTVTVNPALVLRVKTSISTPGSSTPYINTSFWSSDGVIRTYYAIADGLWTDPSIWSLSESGSPSTVYPDNIDKVIVKGYGVTVNSSIKSAGITITSVNDNTWLKVDGGMGSLTVKGNIVMNRGSGSSTGEVLLVQNNGKLDVKNP